MKTSAERSLAKIQERLEKTKQEYVNVVNTVDAADNDAMLQAEIKLNQLSSKIQALYRTLEVRKQAAAIARTKINYGV